METTTKVGIGASILVALVLSFIGGVTLFDDDIYYCEARGLVMQCDKLSVYYGLENGKCWNSEAGNKLCRSGWLEVEKDFENEEKQSGEQPDNMNYVAGEQWLCSPPPGGCEKIQ